MKNYHLSLEAENDLDEIWFFGLDKWGLRQADSYRDQLMKIIQSLSESPQWGKEQNFIAKGLRSYPSGSHRVFYMPSTHFITVIRVLHQSMDTERHI